MHCIFSQHLQSEIFSISASHFSFLLSEIETSRQTKTKKQPMCYSAVQMSLVLFFPPSNFFLFRGVFKAV